MVYTISEACIDCGTCEDLCPMGAISEIDGKMEIDPAVCCGCGECFMLCPTEAIRKAR